MISFLSVYVLGPFNREIPTCRTFNHLLYKSNQYKSRWLFQEGEHFFTFVNVKVFQVRSS